MKSIGKKNLKIIAACSVAIFSLLAVFSGAYAWFTMQMNAAINESNFAVINLGSCDLYSIELFKFNYYVHHYGTSDVVDYFNPESGTVAKYGYDKTRAQFGYMEDSTWHQVSMMNTYDPVELQLFGYGVKDLNCNVVYKFTISTTDLTDVKMDSVVSRILDKTKEDNQLFLSSCTDFDLYMESDLSDSNPAFTDGDDHKMYYPSFIDKSETMDEDTETYFKISYLSSLEASHVNLYSTEDEHVALSNVISTSFVYDSTLDLSFITVYINVNYAPDRLADTMYRIYQENIIAVCDFNFQFYFEKEDE